MSGRKSWAKVLRIIGIIFMSITAVFTLMAGIGTTCVAVAAASFGESMAPIAPYQWVYVLFVLFTTAVGVMMVRATIMMIKSKEKAFRYSILSLVLGIVIGVIHMVVSRALRGKSMPTDGVVYVTVLTLVLLMIYRIPALWKEIDFSRPGGKNDNRNAAAFTLVLSGAVMLTAPIWGAATHTFIPGGVNWANAWPLTMNLAGSLLCLLGLSVIIFGVLKSRVATSILQIDPLHAQN